MKAGLRRLRPLPPLLAGGAAIALSWERWINPFLDSSREMIVPARLAAGERLYRDVAYHYGPAGPWFNALLLKVFGNRWVVLESVGLLLAFVTFASLYRLTRRAGSALSAGAAVTLSAALCLGAPNGGAFLFPYSFGALFALAGAFLCLARSAKPADRKLDPLGVAGLCLALAAKPEIGAAAAAVLLVGAARSAERLEIRCALRVVVPSLLGAALLYGVAFAGLSWELQSPEGPLALFSPPQEWRNVYRLVSGLADPAGSLASLATALFLDLVILSAAVIVAAASKDRSRPAAAELVWVALVLLVTVILASPVGAPVDDRLPALLMPAPLAASLAALALLRRPLDPVSRARFLLFGFAAALGARVVLGLSYGAFTTPYSILALPALAAASAVLVLDLLAPRLSRPEPFRRAAAVVFISLALLGVLRLRRFFPPESSARVTTRSGALRLPPDRAFALARSLEYLRDRARPGDSLVGLPEAGIFNFATGLPNPLRQDAIYPGHLDEAAARRVIERLERSGPRFVLLVNQVPPGFGPRGFGRDYAVEVWDAVERNYRVAAAFGDPRPDAPPGEGPFFIRVYEQR